MAAARPDRPRSGRAGALAVAALLTALSTGCGHSPQTAQATADTGGRSADGASSLERQDDLPAMTTAQAATIAQRIALVRVLRTSVVEGAPGTPFTRTDLRVDEVVKGRLPATVRLQVIGGRLGDVVVTSPVRTFTAGARYVLFFGPDGPVGPTLVPQAVLEVLPSAVGDVVQPTPDGLPLLVAGTTRPADVSSSRPLLADVLFSIRHYLSAARPAPR